MSLTFTRPGFRFAAAAAFAGIALTERLWPLVSRPELPTVDAMPYTGETLRNEAFVGFHGLYESGDQFALLMPYLTSQAHTVIVEDGSDPRYSAETASAAIATNGLLDSDIMLIGVSLGTHKLVACLRQCLDLGITVQGVILISGPARPDDVIWPKGLRRLSPLLHGGPVSKAICAGLRRRNLDRQVPSQRVANGAAMLRQGPGLVPGEFDGIPALVIERAGDRRVRPCFEAWQTAFPRAEHYLIGNPPGHVTLSDCPYHYVAAIHDWRMRQNVAVSV